MKYTYIQGGVEKCELFFAFYQCWEEKSSLKLVVLIEPH